MSQLSVIICAYNPDRILLERVVESLKSQTLELTYWELIIIDNNSDIPISNWLSLKWHPRSKIVSEPKSGLIHARNRGTVEAQFEYIISVDDDTLLHPDYLETARNIYLADPELGIIGGRSFPIYMGDPPKWIGQFDQLLAIRDLGDEIIIQQRSEEPPTEYPKVAPILIAPRKKCMEAYQSFFENSTISKQLGRKGSSLASGEDNDINMFIYTSGYKIGYFPELKFDHIIPAFRTTKKYLAKMAYESNRSWVKMLANHHIRPWKKIEVYTVALRQLKAFFTHAAWKSAANYIKWRGACGKFKGLSELKNG